MTIKCKCTNIIVGDGCCKYVKLKTCFQNKSYETESPFQARPHIDVNRPPLSVDHPTLAVEQSTLSAQQSRLNGQNVYSSNQTNSAPQLDRDVEPPSVVLAGDDDDSLVFPRSK